MTKWLERNIENLGAKLYVNASMVMKISARRDEGGLTGYIKHQIELYQKLLSLVESWENETGEKWENINEEE